MATTFTRIDEILRDRKQDVVGAPQQPLAPGQAPQGNPEAPGFQMNQGAGYAGNARGGKDSAAAKLGTQTNVAQAMATLNKDAITNQVGAKASADIAGAQEKLKGYADKYLEGARKTSEKFNIADADLQKLYAGDEEAYKTIGNRLLSVWNDKDMAEYAPDMKEIESLRMLTEPARRQAYNTEQRNKQFGGRYTSGMSDFDEALTRSANLDYRPIFEANAKLGSDAASYQRQAEDVRKQEAAEFGAEKERIKGAIRGTVSAKAAAETAAQADANRRAFEQDLADKIARAENAQREAAEAQKAKSGEVKGGWYTKYGKDITNIDPESQAAVNALENEYRAGIDDIIARVLKGEFVKGSQFQNTGGIENQQVVEQLNKLAALVGDSPSFARKPYVSDATVDAQSLDAMIAALADEKGLKAKDIIEKIKQPKSINSVDTIIDKLIQLPQDQADNALKTIIASLPTTESTIAANTGKLEGQVQNDSGAPKTDTPAQQARDTILDKVLTAAPPTPPVPAPLPQPPAPPTLGDLIAAVQSAQTSQTPTIDNVQNTAAQSGAMGNNQGAAGGVNQGQSAAGTAQQTVEAAVAKADPFAAINSLFGDTKPAEVAPVIDTSKTQVGEAQAPGQLLIQAPETGNLIKDGVAEVFANQYSRGTFNLNPAEKAAYDGVWDQIMEGQWPSLTQRALLKDKFPLVYNRLFVERDPNYYMNQTLATGAKELQKMVNTRYLGNNWNKFKPIFKASGLAQNWWRTR